MDDPDPIEHPIDGTLDLHTFRPSDTAELLDAYFDQCLEKELYELRIIHGKGQGVLRRTVEAFLRRDSRVIGFKPGGIDSGGWGATLVTLRAPRSTGTEDKE